MNNELARMLRDNGIQTAADHADATVPDWQNIAYAAFVDYARRNSTMTTEQARIAASDTVPEPPDRRAWGAVARRAIRARVVKRIGFTEADDPRVHCNMVSLYQSLIHQ